MDLKLEAISYQQDGNEVRHVKGSNGVTDITDSNDTITISKASGDLVLQKATLGNWTMHMYANVTPE